MPATLELCVQRRGFTLTSTEGDLLIDSQRIYASLEDVVRARGVKVPGKTAIPAGRYRVILTMSNRFKRVLPLLLDVPMFDGIRIHRLNKSSESEGCIGVGFDQTSLTDDWIGRSGAAEEDLVKRIQTAIDAGQKVWITIAGDPPAAHFERLRDVA